MAELRRRRRSRAVALAALAVASAGAAVLVLRGSERLPVAEARRFLHAPLEVGDTPPAPLEPLAEAEARAVFEEARAEFGAGRYDAAARAFERVVRGQPAGPLAGPAQWNLTRARLRSGDGNGALDALDGLLGHYAGWLATESPSLREGIDHLAAGRMPQAHVALDRTIEEHAKPELVPLAWALKARIHWNHGEPIDALRAFASLFASVPDDVAAYRELGGLLDRYADGDAAVADQFARGAEGAGEGWQDIYRYLAARSLLEQNRFAETSEALEQLRAKDPDGDFTHIVDLEHAWNLFRDGRYEEALALFERLQREASPERTRAFDAFFDIRAELPMGIARSQLELGRYDEAIAAFERTLAEHPRSIYVLENQLGLSRAYERSGRLGDAAALLERAVDEHRDEPRIWAVRQQLDRIRHQASAAPVR